MRGFYLRLTSTISIALHTHMALRRSDFLGVLQFFSHQGTFHNSASLYAWYRLGCYETVLNIAKEYQPKSARDITAISVSLAATGHFQDCKSFIGEHLRKLRRNERFAIETAQGIVKFNPYLASKLVTHLRSTVDFRAACHLALGHRHDALKTFLLNKRPTRKDVVAGHYLIEAKATEDTNRKIQALNRHLANFNLSEIQLTENASVFCLDMLRNVSRHPPISGPLVSVIVPAFNAESFLKMGVMSLLEQSYKNLEIIIVNDGSSDATQRIAHNLSSKDTRVRVLNFSQNRGAYAARNAGLKEAKGHFVTVHDADDFAHAQKIEKQVYPLLQDDRLIFSISDMVRVSADGTFSRREIYPLQRMNTSSLLFRRELVLRDCGCWEEQRYGADSEYLFRLRNNFPKNQWVRLRLPLSFAADHSASLTALVSTGGLGQRIDPRRIAYTEAYTHRWLQRLGSQSHG
jgi:hypothetical protein